MGCDLCRELLSDGLDLCVRARDLDARDRRATELSASSDPAGWMQSGRFDAHVARHNIRRPHAPISDQRSGVRAWERDQYDQDLHKWEERARHHLMQGCSDAGRRALKEGSEK